MRFVNLTNYIPEQGISIENSEIKSKKIKGKSSYKLENAKGLIWTSPERNDEFYSEWETVQPNSTKYAIYYDIGKNSQVIKPKDLMSIKSVLEQELNKGQGLTLKQNILNYIKQKYNNPELKHVICEIDNSMDIADLHTLFNTYDIEKVVEGYAKSFSAVYWNTIDDKDENAFQMPSLMIMDSDCMNINQIVKTISYRRRNNGANKITGENTKDIDPIRFKKLIEADLNLNNAIDLLKIKEILNNPNFSMLIDNKLSNFKYLEDAKQIVEQDGICEQLYMVTPGDKTKIKSEILMNSDLQKKLQENRLKHTGQLDIYIWLHMLIWKKN